MPPEMIFRAIIGFRIVTTDPARLAVFYRAIGFDVGETAPIPTSEMELLGLRGAGSRIDYVTRAQPRRSRRISTIRVAYTPGRYRRLRHCVPTPRARHGRCGGRMVSGTRRWRRADQPRGPGDAS